VVSDGQGSRIKVGSRMKVGREEVLGKRTDGAPVK
jgi:hypothetical protein